MAQRLELDLEKMFKLMKVSNGSYNRLSEGAAKNGRREKSPNVKSRTSPTTFRPNLTNNNLTTLTRAMFSML